MNIQYISKSKKNIEGFECATIEKPQALGCYDVNIIDLNNDKIWRNSGGTYSTINDLLDLKNLNDMIYGSENTKIIFFLPQDMEFYYYLNKTATTSNYLKKIPLRNVINKEFKNILSECFDFEGMIFKYENNMTQIGNCMVSSSFYFDEDDGVLTRTKQTNKATTICFENIILTFLNLESKDQIDSFLNMVVVKEIDKHLPEWVLNYSFWNDGEIKENINRNLAKIKKLEEENEKQQSNLKNNQFYKNMLVATGDELVEIVFRTLEEILEISLEDFVDEKKHDFLFKKDNVTFIGEIKGINSNVRNNNISQVDNHQSEYLDALEDQGLYEKTKKILIINHQKDTELSNRISINENQIKKAIRDEVLIIETSALLKILEMHRLNQLNVDNLINVMINNVGLLRVEDIINNSVVKV